MTADEILRAIREQDADRARERMRHLGVDGAPDFYLACALADDARIAAALARDPGLARAPHADTRWTGLHYLCAAPPFGDDDAARRASAAVRLLAAGADASAIVTERGGEDEPPLRPLYFACVRDHVAVARALLAAGADPNDGESIYHAAELDRRECLDLLLAHGARISEAHEYWGNTPLYFLAGYREGNARLPVVLRGMAWLLERGADPNVASTPRRETPLHMAARNGGGLEMCRLLLDHGADPSLPAADGRTALALATRSGESALVELMLARGADPGATTAVDQWLGALMRGDAVAADRWRAQVAAASASLDDDARTLPARAAAEDRAPALRLMAAQGFDLAREIHGATPLHWAAWTGSLDAARALLELGSPVNARDREHGSSPLGWAAHGSSYADRPHGRYVDLVDALLDAGGEREPSINRSGTPPEAMASPAVRARLAERGFAR